MFGIYNLFKLQMLLSCNKNRDVLLKRKSNFSVFWIQVKLDMSRKTDILCITGNYGLCNQAWSPSNDKLGLAIIISSRCVFSCL